MKRAIFLDRDGVLNRAMVKNGKPYPPAALDELEILPGVPEALAALRMAGYLLIVVTNQPDVARGKTPMALVDAMNNALKSQLPLDAIYTCFHDDAEHCDCRKPKPGLLLQAARDFGIDLAASFMVGDRWRDVTAGARAGCKTFFVDYSYDETRPDVPTYIVHSLAEAAARILKTPA